jgi:hypothetical protein
MTLRLCIEESNTVNHCDNLEGMDTPEKQSPTTVTYLSGTSHGLGPGWDVMHVIYGYEDHGLRTANSFVIARDANGSVIRKIDSVPEQWEVVHDEETLRGYRERFDNRDSGGSTTSQKLRFPEFDVKTPSIGT